MPESLHEELQATANGCYAGLNHIMRREDGQTPTGVAIKGYWVLRKRDGTWIDWNQFRYDLAAQYNLKLIDNANTL